MTEKIFLTVIMMVSFSLQSCSKEPEPLGMERIDYNGNELRIDGYYYFDDENNITRDVIFLNQNGIILRLAARISEMESFEEECKNGVLYSKVKNLRGYWGVFQVGGSKIRIDNRYVQVGSMKLKSFSAIGDIFDNESFRIEDYMGRIHTYQFKQFDGKPDSLCRFIP